MPIFVTLVKNTQKGAELLKETGKRIQDSSQWIQAAGGRVIAAYATLGRFDYVWITEFPDSKAGWSVLAKVGLQGAVSTETAEALPIEEFLQIVAKA